MFACRNAKHVERLNVTEVERFVIAAVEGHVNVDSSGPGINATLNLYYILAVD